ncbi:MAG: type VI secretion system protein TssA [Rhodocyclaceae bacterium]|nr:type VI secretion system protein TssA [Rhodocyclaceae bacterium]
MNQPDALPTAIDAFFEELVGVRGSALLAPVAQDGPVGHPAAQDESYRRIRVEREEEDASLPLGPWERELKRANWVAASELAAQALASRSKDLQLAAWLFEALIGRTGLQAVAPCLALIDGLFRRFDAQMHPQDGEHRINLLQWINQKLLPPLRRVPLTAAGGEHEYAWNDWEQAQRNEQLRASLGKKADAEIEGATLAEVGAALACTPQERILFHLECLQTGLRALDALETTLAGQMADDAPGFGAMRSLLQRIEVVMQAETRRRGIHLAPAAQAMAATGEGAESADAGEPGEGMMPDRREAYAALAHIAQILEHIEPHSPVPYLIRRAVAWGNLNTAQLYNEVFLRCGGQINIFELLGLDEPGGTQTGLGAG